MNAWIFMTSRTYEMHKKVYFYFAILRYNLMNINLHYKYLFSILNSKKIFLQKLYV